MKNSAEKNMLYATQRKLTMGNMFKTLRTICDVFIVLKRIFFWHCHKIGGGSTHVSPLRIHTGEEPYSCTICEKSFRLSGYLKNHISTHKTERKHFCKHCEKYFLKADHLNNHLRTLSGEMPYQFNICGRFFADKKSLRKHIIIHNDKTTGDSPFLCGLCQKSFMGFKKLKIHDKKHTWSRSLSVVMSVENLLKEQYISRLIWMFILERNHFLVILVENRLKIEVL